MGSTGSTRRVRARCRRREQWVLLAVLTTVVVLDQASKAWAWRSAGQVYLNAGGSMLVGTRVGAVTLAAVTGAVIDIVDGMLLTCVASRLVRRRRGPGLLVCSSLVVAGWASNLLDRLGLHYVTAPRSARGVVDFIPWHGHHWNLADGAIACGSVGLVLCGLARAALGDVRPTAREVPPTGRPPVTWRGRLAAASGVLSTCVLATIGALGAARAVAPVVLRTR